MRVLAVGVYGLCLLGGCQHASLRPVPPLMAQIHPTVIDHIPSLQPVSSIKYPLIGDTGTDQPLGNTQHIELFAAKQRVHLGLTEPQAQRLAAQASSAANHLDREPILPGNPGPGRFFHTKSSKPETEALRRRLRAYTALELRNQSAKEALERYFQLAGAEAQAVLLRDALPILDFIHSEAVKAREIYVRYPVEPEDVDRERSRLLSQLQEIETGIALLNIDLRRRLGLPASTELLNRERLWPMGDFGVTHQPLDIDAVVAEAVAKRPELLVWRSLESALTLETLPLAREAIGAFNPLLGRSLAGASQSGARVHSFIGHGRNSSAAEVELAWRKKQLAEFRQERERGVADEARAAAQRMNSHLATITLARQRVNIWYRKWKELGRQREAKIPLADLQEAQARLEWLKAQSELAKELMAWHEARVQVKAAQGLLAWEFAPARLLVEGIECPRTSLKSIPAPEPSTDSR